MKFGKYLSLKRSEKKLTIRKLASMIGISPAFLCDLESGDRAFPANSKKYPNLLEKMISELNLNEEEEKIFVQLANESMLEKDKVSSEVKDYLLNVPRAQEALRIAAASNATDEDWEAFIKSLKKDK